MKFEGEWGLKVETAHRDNGSDYLVISRKPETDIYGVTNINSHLELELDEFVELIRFTKMAVPTWWGEING